MRIVMTIQKTALRLGIALGGTVSLFALASPALAQCTQATAANPNDTINCPVTTTTDTTVVAYPTVARAQTFDASAGSQYLNVTGVVDGFGLDLTQVGAPGASLNINNSGSITVNAGNTPTTGGSTGALSITSTGAPITYFGTGTISNLGTGDALWINASTAANPVAINISSPGGLVSTNGNGATLVNTAAGSTINASFSTINAGSIGINAQTSTGTILLNTGAITAAGSGVSATSTTGGITTNVTGNVTSTGAPSAALLLNSTSGPIAVNVTGGNVTNATSTAISADTSGASTVTVAATRTVSGATAVAATDAAGTLAITNSGTITGTTAAVNSVARTTLTNNAGGTINGALQLSALADSVSNAGTLALTGTSTLGDGNDTVTNTGTTTIAAGSSLDLGLGDDTVTNNGTLTINGTLLGGDGIDTLTTGAGSTTTVNGVVNLGLGNDVINNAGTFTVASGATLNTGDGNDTLNNSGTYTIAGTQDFGVGTDLVNNTGTINVTGTGVLANLESFTNAGAGTVNFAAGSTLTAGAATAFTNAGRFNAEAGPVGITVPTFINGATGIIDMQDGANGDITTITGAYVGTAGSRVLIDANADLTASDRLVVSGNITGNTTLGVAYLGTAATFNPTGALVVDGGGTTAAGSFVLDPSSVNNGLLTYGLDLRGADYFLTSNFNAGVTGLAPLARMGSDMWYQSFDAYHDGIAGRHGYRDNQTTPVGVWANLYLSRDKWGETSTSSSLFGQTLTYSSEVESHRRGAQGGIDFGLGGFTVGVTAGYEKNKANNGTVADYNIEGYNYGAYALFGSQAGLYGGVMYKRDDFDIRFLDNTRAFGVEMNDAHSEGFDGELGFRTTGESMKFDLNGGLSWVKTTIDPTTLYGSTFSYDDAESMRGRLGVRMILPQAMGAFVGVKVFHEFKEDSEALTITSGTTTGTLLPDPRGTTFRVEGGLGGDANGGPVVTVWGDFGDSKGLGVRAGFRF
jgi:outer membrane autotransporter protein